MMVASQQDSIIRCYCCICFDIMSKWVSVLIQVSWQVISGEKLSKLGNGPQMVWEQKTHLWVRKQWAILEH